MPDDGVLSVLTIARALIADPEQWCQGANAARPDGTRTEPDDPMACRWCAGGAVILACAGDAELRGKVNTFVDDIVIREHAGERYKIMIENREVDWPFARLWHVNDYRGHMAVLRIFDLALA